MAIKGLQTLYNLILKDVVKGSGQASGIMSIGKDVRKLADKKFQRYIDSAKKQGVDLDKLSEQEIKYTLELNKPKGLRVISADSPEGKGITEMLLGKRGKVIKADFGKPFAEEVVTVKRVITDIKKLEPIEAMKEANRVLKGEGRYKNLSKADREKIAGDESVTDHIFEREIKPDPEDMADGGRIGFAGGTPSPSILDVLPPDFDDLSTDELMHLIKLLQAGEIPQFADGGVAGLLGERPGYQDGLGPVGSVGPVFKTNKPKDALKEIISRMIGVEPAKIPLSDKDALTLMFDLDRAMIGGQKNIFGGELDFGINKGFGRDDTGIGFNFTKQFASGGRVPFSMGRRAFLKLMGSVGAGIGAAKAGLGSLFKAGKPVAKDLTQVPIENAEGMPSWFKPLVNRVIKEGTETTNLPPNKGGAYLNRQIVHSAKLGEGQGVRVYQNLDDQTINVEYQSVDNLGGVDDGIVNLEYRAPQDIYDTGPESVMSKEYQATKKASGQYPKKSAAEFEAHEAYPYQDPKDYKSVTFEGENTVNEVKDLHSDISALKQFGTNKPLTKKELEIAKQKRQRVKEIQNNPSEELAGSGPNYDDFASGGVARMLGE